MEHIRYLLLFLLLVSGGLAPGQSLTESTLPIVIIETNGQQIPDEPKIDVEMGIIWNGPGVVNHVSDPWNHYDGMAGIEIRGSSSQWFFPKKQYALETRDETGNNLNVPLLGMPPENDWILHAPYSDKTMLRNVLTYKLAGDMGHYASRTEYCELVINGEYLGVYVLMEKIKRDVNRVDVTEMDADDLQGDSLTGGYIVKIDKLDGAATGGWFSSFPPYPGAWQNIYYQYHYPREVDIQEAQKDYVQQAIEDFETMMYSTSYQDPETGYPSIVDVNSFVDFVLINELTKNVDGYRLSTFLYKDRDSKHGKWRAGPVWDFNITLGNADYYEGFDPEGWMITGQYSNGDFYTLPFWWGKLMDDPAFFQHLVLRWNIFRNSFMSDDALLGYIDQTALMLEEPQQRNYEKWPILGTYVWPNYFIGDTYHEEVDYLKAWLQDRLDWMDAALKLQPVITEIRYAGGAAPNAGDWVEIYNPTNEAVSLAGWKLMHESGTYFAFPTGALIEAGGFIVACADLALFQQAHPDVTNCTGDFLVPLNDQGGTIYLQHANGLAVDGLTYQDTSPWPGPLAGTGHTIELAYYLTDNAKGENWHLSMAVGGTPGNTNAVQLVPDVSINELMADNDTTLMDEYGDYDDWIELYNASSVPVNIGGMYLTDQLGMPQKYQVPNSDPAATTIPPGGFLLLWADNEPAQGVTHLGFRLSRDGEQAGLYMADGYAVVDTLSFAGQVQDVSYGRLSDGGWPWVYYTLPTPGYSNEAISGTNPEKPDTEIRLYPNPAKEQFTLALPGTLHQGKIILYNQVGHVVYAIPIRGPLCAVNVSGLQQGVYVVVIETTQLKRVKRFIKL